jgi:RHS repeat-associated protein
MLGSTRMVTDQNGAVVGRFDYYPFGGAINASESAGRAGVLCGSGSCYPHDAVTPPAVSQQFTGMQHDFDTGMDYFYARYYSSLQGRFTGADIPLLDQRPADPQSWNLYGYVRNNPLVYVDPTSRCVPGTEDCPNPPPDPGLSGSGQWFCAWFGIYCGGSGGHATPPPPPPSTDPKPDTLQLAPAVCQNIPEGRTFGLSGGIGLVGGQTGTLEIVVNYNSGQVSAFASGGPQIGWNGGLQGALITGFIYSLGNSNASYSGGFTNVSASVGPVGIFTALSSGGARSPTAIKLNRPNVVGGSLGANILGSPATATAAATNYSQPFGLGSVFNNPYLTTPLDYVLYAARQLCK